MRAYATKRPNGLFVISSLPPAICRVGKTGCLDAYIVPGDGFGQHRVPSSAMDYVFGPHDWPGLETIRVEFYATGKPVFLSTRSEAWGNQCMITERQPVVLGMDLWPQPGDLVYCDVFCPWFARSIWGEIPLPGQFRAVAFSGSIL